MSLATRCPACGTIFRVVQDQLKVSDGWVRCGQCHEVFHGVEALFDLESDPVLAAHQGARPGGPAEAVPTPEESEAARRASEGPPTDLPSVPGPVSPFARRPMPPRFAARLAEETARAQARPASPAPSFASTGFAPAAPFSPVAAPASRFDSAAIAQSPPAPAPVADASKEEEAQGFWTGSNTPDLVPRQPRTLAGRSDDEGDWTAAPHAAPSASEAPRTAEPDAHRFADDDEDNGPLTLASMLPDASEWPNRPEPRRRRRAQVAAEAETELRESAAEPAAVAGTEHRFLREARRGAFWKRPAVRGALTFAAVGLAAGAAAQVAWPMRDTLAARYPATRAVFAFACEQLDCKLEPPRSLTSLALDSSSLTRTDTEHVLLFSADLHNRSEQDVRVPSFDLTFMDLNGDVVARKILAPEQIGIRQASLSAEAELHVHARLDVGALDATGFHAEMFYP